ncbi:hypothetical protein HAP41_0000049580 (plasmid) [Bradyrhizobium barranii subsp. apii]|uniref:Uncharacterized protein n=1 Tax=Bradyrhizobium barranii subsp. apii TaxID=2819348 RepID=A0A8T5VS85_9BRAD|nr:hypothetical protein [Bradyrhizobium barranii]UPT92358.1 hypothetical protein HAP41_0000049580 [Bradyrhizobium barranii subsp. apii]
MLDQANKTSLLYIRGVNRSFPKRRPESPTNGVAAESFSDEDAVGVRTIGTSAGRHRKRRLLRRGPQSPNRPDKPTSEGASFRNPHPKGADDEEPDKPD